MKTAGMIGITAWLYYRRVWAAIFLILPGIWLYREFLEEESKKKEQEFQKQFREMIQTLSSALNTGYSVENAFYETQKELKIQYPEEARIAGFGREKTAFRQYLFRKEQPLCFRYENESYELTIEDVKLFPQGYSALALHPEYVRDEPSVLLVDIGGWTVDLMRLDNAVPNAAACRSLELGVIRCIDETMEQVRRSTGLSVTDIQIERVLNGNSCSLDPKAKEIIQKNGRSYTERILSAIMEAGFDLRAIPSVFMGGGSTIVRRHVTPQDRLCRAFYLTDVKANAAGYERIVGQMCAR